VYNIELRADYRLADERLNRGVGECDRTSTARAEASCNRPQLAGGVQIEAFHPDATCALEGIPIKE
jgi:hypothetical protein